MKKEKINYKNGGLTKLAEYVETLKEVSKLGNNFNIKYEFGENSMNIDITFPKSLDRKIADEFKQIIEN